MSRVQELLDELCPEGVSRQQLATVSDFISGHSFRSADYSFSGLRLIRISDVQEGKLSNKDIKFVPESTQFDSKFRLNVGDLLLTMSGSIGRVALVSDAILPAVLNQRVLRIETDETKVSTRFLFYFLGRPSFLAEAEASSSAGSVKNLSVNWLGQMVIPVPPLEVQEEIVRILDTFTELDAELEAELDARKKQYEHYRNSLLTFKQGAVRWVPMGEFAELIRGNGMPKADFSETGVPAIHYGQIYTHYQTAATDTISFVSEEKAKKLAPVMPGDIVITNTSENIDDVGKAVVWLGDQPAVTGGHATVIKHSENPKFLAYYFQTQEFAVAKKKLAVGTKVIDVSAKSLAKIEIPLPERSEQNRIVEILEAFEALVCDISIGLPAELKARRQQYEYYRDQLLTFKVAGE